MASSMKPASRDRSRHGGRDRTARRASLDVRRFRQNASCCAKACKRTTVGGGFNRRGRRRAIFLDAQRRSNDLAGLAPIHCAFRATRVRSSKPELVESAGSQQTNGPRITERTGREPTFSSKDAMRGTQPVQASSVRKGGFLMRRSRMPNCGERNTSADGTDVTWNPTLHTAG